MFRPTSRLRVQRSAGYTLHGQPKPGRWTSEGCTVLLLRAQGQRTSVRADSSASRGASDEPIADARLLVGPDTAARLNDRIELLGLQLRVTAKEPQLDIFGAIDHYRIEATYWQGTVQ
jgi:hypothetical protein